jgi:tRNA-Thr(GGU) m(6)t(6)A37 methyltransferase TsaA
MPSVTYTPIGLVHSPFHQSEGTPVQAVAGADVRGQLEVFETYTDGLRDLEGFSHIILLYHCHFARKSSLEVKPFLDKCAHGVFATRAPSRPNTIGISIVRLLKIDGCFLDIQDVDILDGTPLLDIKPFVPKFDNRENCQIGWLQNNIDQLSFKKDDGRFSG